jgi:hypothetical protein
VFGPPDGVTRPSTCPWVDHSVSRLPPVTRRPFQARFPFGSAGLQLNLATESNSSAHYAKGTRSPRCSKAALSRSTRAPGLPQLVSTRFQVLFTPLVGVLFIIQSPYWFTIGRRGVFSLTGWTPHVHTEFHELRATLEHLGRTFQVLQDCHLLWLDFPDQFTIGSVGHVGARTPVRRRVWTVPISLAATDGIAFAFCSSGY